jgi:hypothetical protein
MASPHLSIRLNPKTLERLDKASRRAGTTRSDLAKTLIEEGLRIEQHPGIVFRVGPSGRRAGLARGPDVWEVVNTFEDPSQPTADARAWAALFLSLSIFEIDTALGYYAAYKDEIDEEIRLNDEAYEEGYADWLARQAVLPR